MWQERVCFPVKVMLIIRMLMNIPQSVMPTGTPVTVLDEQNNNLLHNKVQWIGKGKQITGK